MFSIIASRTIDGFICGVYLPMNDRVAGGLEWGIGKKLFAFIRFDFVIANF